MLIYTHIYICIYIFSCIVLLTRNHTKAEQRAELFDNKPRDLTPSHRLLCMDSKTFKLDYYIKTTRARTRLDLNNFPVVSSGVGLSGRSGSKGNFCTVNCQAIVNREQRAGQF